MNEEVKKYADKFSDEIKEMYQDIREIIMENLSCDVGEKMWAKLPG